MTGGCLSMLVTTLATAYEIDSRGKILFLEDVGEAPYRVERMLMHLKMAGKLDHLAGVVFGDFTLCAAEGPRDVRAVIGDVFAHAPYPVVMGLPAGHGAENFALPFGVKMHLDGDGATLEMLESPVFVAALGAADACQRPRAIINKNLWPWIFSRSRSLQRSGGSRSLSRRGGAGVQGRAGRF